VIQLIFIENWETLINRCGVRLRDSCVDWGLLVFYNYFYIVFSLICFERGPVTELNSEVVGVNVLWRRESIDLAVSISEKLGCLSSLHVEHPYLYSLIWVSAWVDIRVAVGGQLVLSKFSNSSYHIRKLLRSTDSIERRGFCVEYVSREPSVSNGYFYSLVCCVLLVSVVGDVVLSQIARRVGIIFQKVLQLHHANFLPQCHHIKFLPLKEGALCSREH